MTTVEDELPDYARCLQLEHTAFAAELREMLVDLLQTAPPHSHSTGRDSTGRDSTGLDSVGLEIADVACGDGFFSRIFAEIDSRHRVVGLDTDEAYLSAARSGTPTHLADRVSFAACDLLKPEEAKPFEESFDVLFCIDSLESIEDHAALLQQMARLCRPGGLMIVSETDNLHDLIGSWPPEIDNLLHRLEWEGLAESEREGYAFPRYASALLRSAGLRDIAVRSYTFDRSGPFDDLTRAWLAEHFGHRLEALSKGTAEDVAGLRRHLHPQGEDYFANSPDALLTCLRFCILARKPR